MAQTRVDPFVRVLSGVWSREEYDSLLTRVLRLSQGVLRASEETRRSSSAVIRCGKATLKLHLDVERGIVLEAEPGRSSALAREVLAGLLVELEKDRVLGGR